SEVYATDPARVRARCCLVMNGPCASHGTNIYHPATVAFKSQRSRPPLAGVWHTGCLNCEKCAFCVESSNSVVWETIQHSLGYTNESASRTNSSTDFPDTRPDRPDGKPRRGELWPTLRNGTRRILDSWTQRA